MEQGLPLRPLGQLHVYRNDVVEWVVALSAADAAVVMAANLLQNGYDETFLRDEADLNFALEPENKVITIHEYWTGTGANGPERLSCREWADTHGRGFLCTTEY